MAFSIGGLGTGLDTAGIVAQLMQTERIPQVKVQRMGAEASKQVSAWNDLRLKVQAVQTAAEALRTPAKALVPTASSSNATALRATAGEGAQLGTTTLTVQQLATAQQRRTTGLGPAGMTVGAGTSVLTSGSLGGVPGHQALDLSGASDGVHTVTVTRASAPPTAYGGLPATLSATDLTVALGDGTSRTLTLSSSYPDGSGRTLVQDLAEQLDGVATVADVGGRLQIAGLSHGTASTLTLSGGAATALGLPAGSLTGRSAVVVVDGKRQEVEPEPDESTRWVDLGDTGITLEVGGSIGLGTVRANVITTSATETLADLAGRLNASGSPVSASLVTDTGGSSTLVLTATSTGTDGGVHVDSGLTVLDPARATVVDGKDAKLLVNEQVVTRSSNTIPDLVPGVTLDLVHQPKTAAGTDEPMVVSVTRDGAGTKDLVRGLVDALNSLLGAVKTATKYDVASGTGGPLVGNSLARRLSSSVFDALAAAGTVGDLNLAQLGVETTRDGLLDFKAAALAKSVDADPEAVARLVARFADGLATTAKDLARSGGPMTSARDGASDEVKQRQAQADAMEERLTRTEARYKKQFAALETAMARLNSQQSAMSGALSSLVAQRS